ncbi:MAG TPA: hypothetical protein VMU27_03440 [Candidatus Paceibacterota bacterium]|nr:hypothetical protein [Candidatus Paceibacterota bacterium]
MPGLEKTLEAFQYTMRLVIIRWAIFDALETSFYAKGLKDIGESHYFLLRNDYLKTQLIDLRKFFEKDPKGGPLVGKTHLMSSLLDAVTSPELRKQYSAAQDTWDASFYRSRVLQRSINWDLWGFRCLRIPMLRPQF